MFQRETYAFKARVLLTFRTPLASSNLLRHFFNAQATNNNNNNNNNKRRSARSFETEVAEENLASRASKSRESSRPKNEDDDDVKKEKHARDERQQANEDRRHAEAHSPPRARERTTTHGAGWSSRGSLDLDFRDVRVRVPSRRVYFSREEWYKRKRL